MISLSTQKNGIPTNNGTSSTSATTGSYNNKTPQQLAAEREAARRERERVEFYATYDVMTGIRIAATLSCFFAFLVILVAYKSRTKSDPGLDVSTHFISC